MDEIADLKATAANLMAIAQAHAEGMKHMTNALVDAKANRVLANKVTKRLGEKDKR